MNPNARFQDPITIADVLESEMIASPLHLLDCCLVTDGAGAFVMTGLCGGYTTFSSFSLQTLNLARDGEWPRALGNIVASTALCLLAVWAGIALGAFIPGG